MLKVEDIHVYYGNIHAVKGISFHVDEGEIVSLIGANGAGKSTVLKTISGVLRAKSGSISFLGHDITKVEAHKIVRQGIAHVPEGRRIFLKMTVMENLEMGAFTRKEVSKEDVEKVFERFPRLKERQSQIAGTLSGGEQQMLAMGRALMSSPKLLMLDEPSMGLAPLLWSRSSISSKPFTPPAPPFCWWSKMRAWLWKSQTGPMCWRPAVSA